MPQPVTHYLVTRRAIPKEHWSKWWDEYKPYFGLGSSAPDIFYFPVVPNLQNVRKDIYWEGIANPLHSSKSYDIFCSLLNLSKKQKIEGSEKADKLFAFSIGYYCHVITDCIFHPYVYRSTGDHWNTVAKLHELDHKKQEFFIDTALYQKYNSIQDFTRIQWKCSEGTGDLLDFDIAKLLDEALQINYTDCYPLKSDVEQEDHPIQQAYFAMNQAIPALFERKEIHLFGRGLSVDVRDFLHEIQEDFFTSAFSNCDTLNRHTPEELFNFSSSTCRKVFLIALDFWESKGKDSQAYFCKHSTHYLNSGNWNLDTGLPCQYNNFSAMRNENAEHYTYLAEEIKPIIAILQAEYNPSDFENTPQ